MEILLHSVSTTKGKQFTYIQRKQDQNTSQKSKHPTRTSKTEMQKEKKLYFQKKKKRSRNE